MLDEKYLKNFFSCHFSNYIRSTIIEVKTPPLRKSTNNRYFQCIGISKRSNSIPNANDKYIIRVDGRNDILIKYFEFSD